MTSANPKSSLGLKRRIQEAPYSAVSYVELALLLEEEGDLKGAAAAFKDAHFLLPNAPVILDGLSRLGKWIDATAKPVTVFQSTAEFPLDPAEDPDPVESRPPEIEEADEPVDELDSIIEGLGNARLSPIEGSIKTEEPEWREDEGVFATETIAQIYIAQKQFGEAIRVYDILADKERDPGKSAILLAKSKKLRDRLKESS